MSTNQLSIDPDETQAEIEESRRKKLKPGDRQVCSCGHGMSRHVEAMGKTLCNPARMVCGCQDRRAVVEVQDTRLFLYRSTGIGAKHALVKGLVTSESRGHEVTWLIPVECEMCGAEKPNVVGLKRGYEGAIRVEEELPQSTKFLCEPCLEKLLSGPKK